ncbi:MAG: M23 family metallopeptidase [Candidatus Cloacimonadales bacterium]
MKKFLFILLLISIAISFYFYYQNNSLRLRLIAKGEEISENDKYVELLKDKVELLSDLAFGSSKEEELDELIGKLEEQETVEVYQNPQTPDLVPLAAEYKISQKFSSKHPGWDFAVKSGSKVLSAAAGEVLSVYDDEYFGRVILIDHFNQYATLYAHLQSSLVQMGESVEKGQTIALSGNSGNSTAPHLHFEIMVDGANVDPGTILK